MCNSDEISYRFKVEEEVRVWQPFIMIKEMHNVQQILIFRHDKGVASFKWDLMGLMEMKFN